MNQGKSIGLTYSHCRTLLSISDCSRTVEGEERDYLLKPNSSPLRPIDYQGRNGILPALSGTPTGKQLTKIAVLKDYWFDWKTYNPKTSVYNLGDR